MVRKRDIVGTGVRLEREVLEYLDELARQSDRSRSWILNRLVRDHAQRHNAVDSTPVSPMNQGVFANSLT